jgi:hypothetical protein
MPRQHTKVDIGAEPIFGPKTLADSEVVAGLRQIPLAQKGTSQTIMSISPEERHQQSPFHRGNFLSGVIQAAILRRELWQSGKVVQQQAMEKHIPSASLSQNQTLIAKIKKSHQVQRHEVTLGQKKSQRKMAQDRARIKGSPSREQSQKQSQETPCHPYRDRRRKGAAKQGQHPKGQIRAQDDDKGTRHQDARASTNDGK